MPRLFLAVWPTDDVAAELTALPRKDQRGVRFVSPENWHITLSFLGEADPAAVVDAMDDARLPPARAVLGPAVDVLDERALVVPVAGLDDLATTVIRRIRSLGSHRPRNRFVGHLTVARVKPRVPMPVALGHSFRAEFDVDDVVLVSSRLHPDGARYEIIHSWPLPSPTVGR